MRKLLFVTGNPHKFAEAHMLLKARGIIIKRASARFAEARAEDCREIARSYAVLCAKLFRRPLFVEDAGLFIRALGGFPGTCSAYVHPRIGNGGILRLMRGIIDRRAEFVSAVAYADADGLVRVFEGRAKGRIAREGIGKGGFGYDPVFIPYGKKKTYAQEKGGTHRDIALGKLASYLKSKGL